METKRSLAEKYIALKKLFDGHDFKEGIQAHNVDWIVKEFTMVQIQRKIEAVEEALRVRNEKKLIICYVRVNTTQGFQKEFRFSGFDKEALFASVTSFADGFMTAYCLNSQTPVSHPAVMSLDGYMYWHTVTNEVICECVNERGEVLTNVDSIL